MNAEINGAFYYNQAGRAMTYFRERNTSARISVKDMCSMLVGESGQRG